MKKLFFLGAIISIIAPLSLLSVNRKDCQMCPLNIAQSTTTVKTQPIEIPPMQLPPNRIKNYISFA